MKDDNERVGAHSGIRQSARSTDDDQRRQRRRKSSSSSTEDGEVRAEDNGRREGRKKSATSKETALPKSTNTHAGASACTADQYAEEKKSTYTYGNASARPIGRAAACHAEERTSTRQLKSTYTHDDASVRPASGRAATCHAEERISAKQLKSTYTPVDASVRPVSGRATAQRAEERTAMEEELSSLQLTMDKDLQSPTITSRRQESRVETETSLEEEQQRPESSAMGHSAQESTERHQRLEATKEQPTQVSTDLQALQNNADGACSNRTFNFQALQGDAYSAHPNTSHLEHQLERQSESTVHEDGPGSGFDPARLFSIGQGRPLTTGVSIEQEAQHPEVRLYSHRGNAYGAYPHGASLYGHMGDASDVYPSANTSRPETYLYSRPDNAHSAYPNGVQLRLTDAQMMEVNKVLLEQQQTGKSVVQFCESTTPGNAATRPYTGSRQNTTVKKSAEQTSETTELKPAGTVYHTARMKRDDSSYREEPSTKSALRTKVRKVLQYGKEEENGPSDASLESSSEDEIVTSRKHILKPPKFDGQSSFETFMAQFSNCAEYNKWNEAQKLAHLRHSLEKEAAYILWDYGKDAIGSLSGLMQILETRFGGKAVVDKH